MKEILEMAEKKEKELLIFLMEVDMKEIIKMMKELEKVLFILLMV